MQAGSPGLAIIFLHIKKMCHAVALGGSYSGDGRGRVFDT